MEGGGGQYRPVEPRLLPFVPDPAAAAEATDVHAGWVSLCLGVQVIMKNSHGNENKNVLEMCALHAHDMYFSVLIEHLFAPK